MLCYFYDRPDIISSPVIASTFTAAVRARLPASPPAASANAAVWVPKPYTGADSCAFRTPVYHGDHIFQVLRIQRPDIESADRSLRNNIHNGSTFHDNSVNPRIILKMKSLGIYRMKHLENSV